jgi:multiple sugar transport system substrate-binding protein
VQAAPRKRSLIFAIVVLAVVAVAATSGTGFAQSRKAAAGCPAPDPNIKTLNLLLIDSPSADAIKSFIPAWEKKTGIKVNVTSYDYNVAHQKELLSYKQHAGAYDVAQFDNTYIVPFGSQNLMTPLDACVKLPTYDLNDFPKSLRDYGDYKGHTLGLMLSTEPMIQWYRKDIYAELHLKPAKTWAEWKQNAITIQKSGKAAGNMMGFGPNSDWWWWLLLWDNGGHLYDKNFKPSVNSPAAIKAADFLKSLLPYSTKGAISVSGDDATAKFVTEDVGALINFSGYYSWIKDPKKSKIVDKLGTARAPVGSSDVTELAGWNIGIPADSKNPGNGWKFLEFVLGKANALKYHNAGAAAIGRISITSNKALLKKEPYLKLLNLPSTTRVERYPQLRTFPEVDKAMADALGNIMSGKSSSKSALDALQKQLTSLLANEKQ